MLPDRSTNSADSGASRDQPSDAFLIESLRGGDSAALDKLMDRYDRLVRYVIYQLSKDHCRKDPEWLDSVASAAWLGFFNATCRADAESPRSTAALLTQIARNQAVTALRKTRRAPASVDVPESAEALPGTDVTDDPAALNAEIEDLGMLQACLERLSEPDRALTSQLVAITERRWRAAAEALGMSESTLRSKWRRVVDQLRECMDRKSRGEFAPRGR
ncbi:MAG: sigma-70 family RNA polymerase sigma factor [Phycisphaerae bacterium]|jgi:RNA polymerase sigma factor (sigma-70 family)